MSAANIKLCINSLEDLPLVNLGESYSLSITKDNKTGGSKVALFFNYIGLDLSEANIKLEDTVRLLGYDSEGPLFNFPVRVRQVNISGGEMGMDFVILDSVLPPKADFNVPDQPGHVLTVSEEESYHVEKYYGPTRCGHRGWSWRCKCGAEHDPYRLMYRLYDSKADAIKAAYEHIGVQEGEKK